MMLYQIYNNGQLPVVDPESEDPLPFPINADYEMAEIILKARPVLREAVNLIRMGEAFPEVPVDLKAKAKSGKIHDIFYKKFVKADGFFVKETCISCGVCVTVCPMNNISLEKDRPLWSKNCTHCMACICNCPVEAIEYGKKSRGKPRYHCPDLKQGRWTT